MIKIGWALRKAKIMLTAKIASETQKGVPVSYTHLTLPTIA